MKTNPQKLIKKMADELPGLVASALVHLDDGLVIAEISKRNNFDASQASAYLASIVQSNLSAIKVLTDNQVTDDILITTDKNYFLIRHVHDQPFFLFVMTEKDEWLGRARLLMKQYDQSIIEAMDYL